MRNFITSKQNLRILQQLTVTYKNTHDQEFIRIILIKVRCNGHFEEQQSTGDKPEILVPHHHI